ncbi:MAG: hypothetical protein OEY49_20220, partial [Candidatus Heimdallarchaeota archaeon]|nr:hypothetical protein [Candidatus Heimdallarchaeota archaeon]
MNENHFGYYHDSCNLEYLFDEFNNGDLWKHTAFQVYKHDLCPVTFRDESYIPFFTCTNYLNEIDEKFQVINKKFKNINEILGNFSHIRLCKNEDEILLSKKLLTQTSLICFNPNRRGRIGFLNRHYLKKILPQNMRYLVEIARKSPKYKFINL